MKGHQIAEQLAKQVLDSTRNEADTRHQIIDRLLHEVLGWPRDSVKCEERVHDGYIDFVLRDRAQRPVLLIEAKREGKYFALPAKLAKRPDELAAVRLRTLATDPNIGAAVKQAAGYCPAIGCQFACVTNGDSFILFRSFIPGADFMDSEALVIPRRQYFADRFTHVCSLLGYEAVTGDRSLQRAFEGKKAPPEICTIPKTESPITTRHSKKTRTPSFSNPLQGVTSEKSKRQTNASWITATYSRAEL